MNERYPDSAPSKVTVKLWFPNFERSCTNTDDPERSGRPNEVVIPENRKLHKIILANREVKFNGTADTLNISK